MALEEMLRGRMGSASSRMRQGIGSVKTMGGSRPTNRAGGPVPGLAGLKFAPDYATGLARGVQSHIDFHTKPKESHPAVGWSRSQAGLGTSAIDSIMPRLQQQGITRSADGTWGINMGANQAYRQSQAGRSGPASAIPSTGVTPTRPLSTQAAKSPATSSTRPGTVTTGNIGPNTTTNIDVSGGVQTSRDAEMAAIADYLKNGGTPPDAYTRGQPTPPGGTTPTEASEGVFAPARLGGTSQGFVSPERAKQMEAEMKAETAASKHPSTASVPPLPSQAPAPVQRPMTQGEVKQQMAASRGPGVLGTQAVQNPVRRAGDGLPIIQGGEPLTPEAKALAANQAKKLPGGGIYDPPSTQNLDQRAGSTSRPAGTEILGTVPGGATILTKTPPPFPTTKSMPIKPPTFGQGPPTPIPSNQARMPGNGSFERGMANMRNAFAQAFGQQPARTVPGAPGGSFRDILMGGIQGAQQQASQAALANTPAAPPPASPPGGHAMNVAAPAPGGVSGPTTTGSYGPGWPGDQMDVLNPAYDQASMATGVPGNVIKAIQTLETGGDINGKTGTTNCTIRPEMGCIALNSGIYQTVADSYGLDFNRIVNDPAYAAQAIGTLLGDYADDDASKWGGPAGVSVLDYGGWDAVTNIFFGGNVNGGFTDELGTGSDEYRGHYQNYLEQLGGVGTPNAAPTAAPTSSPSGQLPIIQGGEPLTPEAKAAAAAQQPTSSTGYQTPPADTPFAPARMGEAAPTSAGGYMHPESQLGQMAQGLQQPGAARIAAPGAGGVGAPQGVVQSPLVSPNAQGMNWDAVNRWDAEINAAVAKYPEVDPAMIKAAMAMESLGNPTAKNPASSSYGVLQIQPEWHRESARQLGLTLSADGGTPAEDIEYWAALMAGKAPGQAVPGSTPLERYANNYGTGGAYFQDINSLMSEIHSASGGVPAGPATASGTAGTPGIGDVGNLGVRTIQGPTPGGTGNNTGVSPTPLRTIPAPTPGGSGNLGGVDPVTGQVVNPPMKVGADAVAAQPKTQPELFPGSSTPMSTTDQIFGAGANSKIDTTAVLANSQTRGAPRVPVDPNATTPAATGAPGSLGDSTTEPRPPDKTMQMDVVAMPSGGIAAAPGTDESWMVDQAGGAEAPISSEYKGQVIGPWYGYQVGHGASASEHAGYDIAYPSGTPLQATPLLAGTVECSGCGSYCTGGVTADGGLYCDGVGVGEIRVSLDPSLHGGQQITMLYGHMLTSAVEPGQVITPGTPIGETGYAGTGAHLHQEAWGHCPGEGYAGDYRYLDPTLVANGYYQTHSVCSDQPLAGGGGTTEAPSGKMSYQAGGATPSAPATTGTGSNQQVASQSPYSGYNTSAPPIQQQQAAMATEYQAPQHAAPTSTGQTYQVVTDSAGRQYEVMADGSQRLIYDPAW